MEQCLKYKKGNSYKEKLNIQEHSLGLGVIDCLNTKLKMIKNAVRFNTSNR